MFVDIYLNFYLDVSEFIKICRVSSFFCFVCDVLICVFAVNVLKRNFTDSICFSFIWFIIVLQGGGGFRGQNIFTFLIRVSQMCGSGIILGVIILGKVFWRQEVCSIDRLFDFGGYCMLVFVAIRLFIDSGENYLFIQFFGLGAGE